MGADYDFSACATVLRERLECALSPTEAVLHLRDDTRPFALIGAWAGGGALLGSEPVAVVQEAGEVFGALDRQPRVAVAQGAPDAIGGGWFGYLGFSLGAQAERLDPPPPAAIALPEGSLGFYDHVLRLDADGQWWFEALLTPDRRAAIADRHERLAARMATPADPRRFATHGWRWHPSPAGHARGVEACRERIRAGDLFQANLAMRLQGRIEGDPIDVFAAAARALPTDRGAFVTGPWGALASLSPELFLARSGREIRSAPIKGTRPADRGHELRRSDKDRAENVMIVDLMRNDLGRVCVPGTVRVPALAHVRRHAGVWHLVSEVAGRLRDDVSDAELMGATFPPGSVTGAPKIAALNVISELESTRREAYTGAIGFASPLGRLELSVAIRTFEFCGPHVWLGAGGGVVVDSTGADEATEAAAKARPLLHAIGAALPDLPLAGSRAPAPAPARRRPRPVPRPDAAAGVYETVRVLNGIPRLWAAHAARLAASLAELYGLAPPRTLARTVAELAAGVDDARLRIDVIPGQEPQLQLTPHRAAPEPILRPVCLPGGLGAHKWRDRTLLQALEAEDPGTLPLLVDADGYVLETSRTAVVIEADDGSRWMPPGDGRILPSVTAAASGARARAFTLGDLNAACGIYVASALRGLQPAKLAITAGVL